MEQQPYRKVAGEAFCMITGADLEREGLTCHQVDVDQPPSDDVDDEDIPTLDGYENLPVPDPNRVSHYWQNVRHQFDRSQKRSEEHTSELQSRGHLVCRPLLEKK